jgi:hypothetical protein
VLEYVSSAVVGDGLAVGKRELVVQSLHTGIKGKLWDRMKVCGQQRGQHQILKAEGGDGTRSWSRHRQAVGVSALVV